MTTQALAANPVPPPDLPVDRAIFGYLAGRRLMGANTLVVCPSGHGTLSFNLQNCPTCGTAGLLRWFAPFI